MVEVSARRLAKHLPAASSPAARSFDCDPSGALIANSAAGGILTYSLRCVKRPKSIRVEMRETGWMAGATFTGVDCENSEK